MVKQEIILEDIKRAGGCEYCKYETVEKNYYDTAPSCGGDCLGCIISECPCNGCIDASHWIYFREEG